ncbi:MAG: HAD hydrolase-like protein [Myxococcota bacterium]|nr:HAD hydrolase-like protein [Deltaproteobacteria bacterium]MDQ3339618.1 HAD hydrolase-like protein [Myxococcota bacterium]
MLLARWSFAPVLGQRAHVALKPSPDAAFEVAGALGIAPEDCAFIGDSAIDILTAQAARMMPVAVSWGFRPRVELAAAKPALLADAPADLLTLSGSRAS